MTRRCTARDVYLIVAISIIAMIAKAIWPRQREFLAGWAGWVIGYIGRRLQ